MSGTKTSSPGPISKANNAQYKPKVPFATEIACLAPVKLSVINDEIEKIPFGARGDSNYKWRKNGVYIDAPHASILDIKTLTEKNAGVYQLEVTNELGVFLSEPYTLKVRDPVLNLEYPKTAIPLGEYLEIIVWSKEKSSSL